MRNEKPKIYGLVLSGGKSTRMGKDKGLIKYHDVPQREYMYQLLGGICDKTFLSVRNEQEKELRDNFDYIVDKNEYRGPLNGILSAHAEFPDVAWLVLACDLPLLNKENIKELVSQRNLGKVATAFATNKTKLPEPLIAIWEPSGLDKAITYMETSKSSCPRKFLINSEIKLVYPKNDEVLYNANSIEEYKYATKQIVQ
ncbi:hypothetical protein MTsPCn9_06650 [Croceitalea sp. MTPC9]|uniref:NTP transferase domain-containing protein n=1 Tax=unclassified Croceitalea TaxID=2632280 RepID=UPI002B37C58C|nr:hypothetical protein MTsPCn6_02060 [Croceitalea sp. MTPC6]GMN15729.1 hypothetical protein MTsPCn9_06650 [Croceitalea sp. MTPC9]